MRSILSVVLLSTAVIATPALSASAASASASIDTRVEAWGEIKIALPDGLFVEDKVMADTQQEQDDIVPMIVMEEADLPLPSLVHKPLYKHQRIENGGKPAYKHLGLAESEVTFDPVKITLLLPQVQAELNKQREAVAKADTSVKVDVPVVEEESGKLYRKFTGLSDKGESQKMTISTLPENHQVEEESYPNGIRQKKVVGLDKNGGTRYLDIPYYNRISSPNSNK